jgi:hypothetical protein
MLVLEIIPLIIYYLNVLSLKNKNQNSNHSFKMQLYR